MKIPKRPGALVVVVQIVFLLHLPSTAELDCRVESAALVAPAVGTLA